MSKKIISLALVLIMCLAIIPMTAFAADGKWGFEDVVFTDSRGNKVTIPGGSKSCATKVVSFTNGSPWTSEPDAMDSKEILGAPDRKTSGNGQAVTLGSGGVIILEFDVYIYDGSGNDIYVFEVGERVEATKIEVSSDNKNWIHVGNADGSISGVDMNGKVPADGKYKYVRITDMKTSTAGEWPGADVDAVAGINVSPYSNSGWAESTIEKAFEYNLIPEVFFGADLKQNITRAEFAAVAVKVYENLTGKKVTPAAKNPFTDTSDPDVLKAYNVGITSGTSATTFSPDVLLNREQCATMLTRVLKAAYIPGWTGGTDGNFTLNFTMPAKFADDAKISDWAKPSVYFMAANGIISGTGNNMFSPRAVTAAEIAVNYASATREQALVIGARLVENLGGKPLDYKEGDGTTEPTKPTEPPSGKINTDLVGKWVGFISQGVTQYFYFKEDGTFQRRMDDASSGTSYVWRGSWSVSDGTIYMTGIKNSSWTGRRIDVPPADKPLVWRDFGNISMSVSMGEDTDGSYAKVDGTEHYAEKSGNIVGHIPEWIFDGWE